MAAPKLTEEQKRFLVVFFARWGSPKKAANALKAEYGVEITRQGAERFNPTSKAGATLSARHRKLYDETRAKFETEMDGVAETKRSVRVRMLAEAAQIYYEAGNYLAMARMLEAIAKEMGNIHTNERRLTGKDGGPIQTEDLSGMTLDEMRAELAALLAPKSPKPKE